MNNTQLPGVHRQKDHQAEHNPMNLSVYSHHSGGTVLSSIKSTTTLSSSLVDEKNARPRKSNDEKIDEYFCQDLQEYFCFSFNAFYSYPLDFNFKFLVNLQFFVLQGQSTQWFARAIVT
jgi:hypothetical protein